MADHLPERRRLPLGQDADAEDLPASPHERDGRTKYERGCTRQTTVGVARDGPQTDCWQALFRIS